MSELAAAADFGTGDPKPPSYMPALRFVAIFALLTALMYAWGEGYSSGWRKPFEVAIAALSSTIVVERVDVALLGEQRVFALQARTRNIIRTPRGAAPAGIEVQSTTLQAYAHHHLILIFAALGAWPVRRPTDRAVLLAAGIPAIALVTMLDLPFTLVGAIQDMMLAASDPGRLGTDAAVLYCQFLQRGGRHALSLAAAALVIVLVAGWHGPDSIDAATGCAAAA